MSKVLVIIRYTAEVASAIAGLVGLVILALAAAQVIS